MTVAFSNFKVVKPIWEEHLWPERRSEIKPMSSMVYMGGYDMSIYEKYKPTFWVCVNNLGIVAVNSGHRTSDNAYRSRGIWVDPVYRGQGLSTELFLALEAQAIKEGCEYMWSCPRWGSEFAYFAYGFEQTSEWFDEGMEFGPNCYVRKLISK
jgi:GNAT superfamily N-acetyltransferase